jgi:hypothetical protein
MPGPLDAALSAIFGNPDLSYAAVYTPSGGSTPRSLRVVSSTPTDAVSGLASLGGQGVSAQRASADMLIADVPAKPTKRDFLQIETSPGSGVMGPVRRVQGVTEDARGIFWRVTLADG